jgi:hypothetical protein
MQISHVPALKKLISKAGTAMSCEAGAHCCGLQTLMAKAM